MTTLEFIRQYPDKWKFASELIALYATNPKTTLSSRFISEKTGKPQRTVLRWIDDIYKLLCKPDLAQQWLNNDSSMTHKWLNDGSDEKLYYICKSMIYDPSFFENGSEVAQQWLNNDSEAAQPWLKSEIQSDLQSDSKSKKRKEPKEKNIIDNIVENNNININNNIFKKNSIITSSDKSSEDNNASEKSSQASPAPKEGTKVVKDKLTLPPPMQDVTDYFTEKGHPEMAEQFYDFYQSVGWMVGKNRMKDLKATIRNWIRRSGNFSNPSINTSNLSVVSPVVRVSQAAVRDLESDAELMAKVDASIEKINPNAVTPDTRHFLACMIDRFPYAFTKGVPITEKAARFYANKVSKEYFIEVLQDIEDNKPEFNNLGLYLHSKLGS